MEQELIQNTPASNQPLEVIAGASDRPLVIGEIEIPCYVLADETRVLSQRGVFSTFGTSRGGSKRGGAQIPRFLESRTLHSYIPSELRAALKDPILFTLPDGGLAYGYPAGLLPAICDVILSARSEGRLSKRQVHLADRADLLLRGLATVGIIGLVDEATGYQEVRARRALATILEEFIAKELQPWTKTFPYEFYAEIFRLHGWPGPHGAKRPSVIGHYTNDIVYARLAPGVLDELRRLNPKQSSGNRRNRHHQWFTTEYGHPKLREHLAAVTALMRAATDWDDFLWLLQRAYPIVNTQLPLAIRMSEYTAKREGQIGRRGRPIKYPMPEQIPDTAANVARAVMNTPPKKRDDWEFMKRRNQDL